MGCFPLYAEKTGRNLRQNLFCALPAVKTFVLTYPPELGITRKDVCPPELHEEPQITCWRGLLNERLAELITSDAFNRLSEVE